MREVSSALGCPGHGSAFELILGSAAELSLIPTSNQQLRRESSNIEEGCCCEPTKKHQGETNIRVVSSRRRQEAGGRLFEDKTVQEAGCMWSTTSSSRVLVVVVVVVGSRVVVVEGRRQLACGDHPWHTSSNHNQHSLQEGKDGKEENQINSEFHTPSLQYLVLENAAAYSVSYRRMEPPVKETHHHHYPNPSTIHQFG